MKRSTVSVAKVVRTSPRSPDSLVGCAVPLSPKKILLADVYQMAGELERRGAEATVINSFGGDNIRLCTVGFSNVPCLFGRYWRGFAPWPRKILAFLSNLGIPYCTRFSGSDEETLRVLRIRL